LDGLIEAICLSNMPYLYGEELDERAPMANITVGKRYKVALEGDWLRVWDDDGEDYLYPLHMFQLLPVRGGE